MDKNPKQKEYRAAEDTFALFELAFVVLAFFLVVSVALLGHAYL